MAFDWYESKVPKQVQARFPESRKRMHEQEIRYRAGLYRRLGRDQETAVARCLAQLSWGYEAGGEAPVAEADVRRIVGEVYR